MFAEPSRLKKFQARPHPGTALADGTIAASPAAAIVRWRGFAHGVHAAKTVAPEHIVALADEPILMFRGVRRELDQVPRIAELTKGFRRLAPGRASGEDVLPPELFINFLVKFTAPR